MRWKMHDRLSRVAFIVDLLFEFVDQLNTNFYKVDEENQIKRKFAEFCPT